MCVNIYVDIKFRYVEIGSDDVFLYYFHFHFRLGTVGKILGIMEGDCTHNPEDWNNKCNFLELELNRGKTLVLRSSS